MARRIPRSRARGATPRGPLRLLGGLLLLPCWCFVDRNGTTARALSGVLAGAALVAGSAAALPLAVVLRLAVVLQGRAATLALAVVLRVGPLAFTVVLALTDMLGGLVVFLGALL